MAGRKIADGRGRAATRRALRARMSGATKASVKASTKASTNGMAAGRRLRSQEWFDNSAHPDMTAIYLERYLNYGLTLEELQWRQADHRHRADGLGPLALQPSPPRARQARARRHPRGGWGGDRIPGASDPGDRQATDGGTRPQPRLSRPRRGALRIPARRRGADDRLRQDDAGLPHGGGDREHPRDRALGRPDAERLAPWQAGGLRHHLVAGAPGCSRPARSTTPRCSRRWRIRRPPPAIATPWARPRP